MHSATITPDGRRELLERSRELSLLDEWLSTVSATSGGRLVLVAGEAGVGKTALLRRFCDSGGDRPRSLWGGCEPLFTPRPLGPLVDVAELTGGELAQVVTDGERPHDVVGALVRALRARSPTVLVLEDLHWADEATLDVLTLLARRMASVPALVLATYRDDELDRSHPLRIVLGELATGEAVTRLRLPPLSAAAVSTLAEPHGVDGDELYRRTAGNPFFVTEALGAAGAEIPPTVRDAVLARVARLSPAAQTLLEAAAVVPPPVELWLLEALAGTAAEHLEECLAAGMLTAVGRDVAFRHELARIAVEQSLSPHVTAALHTKALAALRARSAGAPDIARLAHHADAAGDAEAVLRFAPDAAARASAVGAHREAAAQYERALRFADRAPLDARAELLDARARECTAIGQFTQAIKVHSQALECHEALGDRRKQGDCLRTLSWLLWAAGRIDEAERAARRAVGVLESLPPGRELAMARWALSNLALYASDFERAVAWAKSALDLARRLDDSVAIAHALTNINASRVLSYEERAYAELERDLEFAREAGLEQLAATAFCFLAVGSVRSHRHSRAEAYSEEGSDYCSRHDLDGWRPFLIAVRAQLRLQEGRWGDAADSAMLVLAGVGAGRGLGPATVIAHTVLGRIRARRGDPECWPMLDEALSLAEPSRQLTRIWPAAAARAEAAWLEGRPDSVSDATEAAFEVARRYRDPWAIGELACWRSRAGIEDEVPHDVAEPYALQLAGDWRGAADHWTRLGCPYEAALALADSDDEFALRQALEQLQALDARPAAAIVARRLRQRGAMGVPRGPRGATRQNPAHLTPREVEILALVAQGLRNADIAQQLFLSEKTVAHHVSAILAKLDVPSRGQASAAAVRLGLAGQDR